MVPLQVWHGASDEFLHLSFVSLSTRRLATGEENEEGILDRAKDVRSDAAFRARYRLLATDAPVVQGFFCFGISVAVDLLSGPDDEDLRPDDEFLMNYVAYHHFRSLGWVPRAGIKFGVDWLLYNRGPVFDHILSWRRLMTLYHELHGSIHAKHAPVKVIHRASDTATALGWITPAFELYCVTGPNVSEAVMTQGANKIIQWAKREEERLFIIGGGVF